MGEYMYQKNVHLKKKLYVTYINLIEPKIFIQSHIMLK